MKIKASAKIKRRYLLVKGRKKEVEEALLTGLGTLGLAKAKMTFAVIREKEEGMVVVAIERNSLDAVRAAFEISPVEIRIVKVSGTIKGLRHK